MKNTLRRVLAIVLTVLVALSLSCTAFAHSGRTDSRGGHKDNKNKSGLGSYHYHCGGYPAHLHPYGYCPYKNVFPKSVSVKASKTTLRKGESVDVTATVNPSNSCDTSVSWASSDSSVATIRNGVITAVGYGTAVISAESFNEKVGKITITVKEITAKSVTIEDPPEQLYIFDDYDLTCNISPEDVDNPVITWASSDNEIATVSSDGKLQAHGAGTVTISATASNGVVGSFVLLVEEKVVESVDIPESPMLIYLCDSETIPAVVTPSDATYPELSWSSSDEDVIVIDENGLATAVGNGTAIVTATTQNGLSDTVRVKVEEIVAESIQIKGVDSLQISSTAKLSVDYNPTNTSVRDIDWVSSDEDIIAIDEDGTIHAKQLGVATITAKQKDATASKEIEVTPIPVESVEIDVWMPDEVQSGYTEQFDADVYPKDATFPEVKWSSSNKFAGTIDDDGNFTARMFGTTTITAMTQDGVSDSYEVKVTASGGTKTLMTGGAAGVAAAGYAIVKKRKKE